MRVLMTGATGLIGKEIGKRLVEAGHDIVVISRDPVRARLEIPFPAKFFSGGGGGREAFPPEALNGVEGVIHLAGEPIMSRWTPEKKRRIRDSRVEGTRRLVSTIGSAIERGTSSVRILLSASAIGIYGDRGDEVLTESSEPSDDFLAGLTRDWEAAAIGLTKFPDIRVACIRTGIVLARHGGGLHEMLPVFSHGLGGKIGRGRQWMSWIHLEDIARLYIFALENSAVSGPVNGVAPQPVRNETFTRELSHALAKPAFMTVPEAALKTALGAGLGETVLASQRVSSARAGELGFRFLFPDLKSAFADICAPLRNGRREMLCEQWLPKAPKDVVGFFSENSNLQRVTPRSSHLLYRDWKHTQESIPMGTGTLVRDRVSYRLPLGLIGDLAAGWAVGGDLREVFASRRQKLQEHFREDHERPESKN